MDTINIHDCPISYDPANYDEDDGAGPAVHYLEKYLDHEEISTLMHAAKVSGRAVFETNHNKNYQIVFDGGRYVLSRRHSS